MNDPYKAGPCPTCGDPATSAERRMDGRVFCDSDHSWYRDKAGISSSESAKEKKAPKQYTVVRDGNQWCCFDEGFINLQESDNYAFGDTVEEAVENFLKPSPKTFDDVRVGKTFLFEDNDKNAYLMRDFNQFAIDHLWMKVNSKEAVSTKDVTAYLRFLSGEKVL